MNELMGMPRADWWRETDEPHGPIFASVQFLKETQGYRETANKHFMHLYSNRAGAGFSGTEYQQSVQSGQRIKLNIVKSCIDTAVAQIATQKTRAMHKTRKGNYKQRKRAERLDKFSIGQFRNLKIYKKALGVFLHGGIFGTGAFKIWPEDGKIHAERAPINDIVIDDNDGRDGDPRNFFYTKQMDRDVAKETWHEFADEIEAAANLEDEGRQVEGITNPVSVIEAVHLPSGPKASDGRHVISVSTATLHDEEWISEKPPFVFWHWSDPPHGFLGIGLAEELAPIQIEINYIAQKIQILMNMATTMAWVQKGSGVDNINNRNMAVREYSGRPPIFQTISAVSAEYFHHLDRLITRAYELTGVSQLQAQAKKPAGLESGAALRAYNDIATLRFKHTGQRWEEFFLEVDEAILEAARQIQEDGDLSVLAAGDQDVEKIDFSECVLDPDEYVTQTWPVSLLPEEPAGIIQRLQEIGQISPSLQPYMVQLLNGIPDLHAVVARETAALELAEMMVGNILEYGRYEPPWPEMDFKLTRETATKSLLRAHIDGVEPEREELLRRFIGEIDDMQAAAQAAAAGPPPGPAGAPPMPGGPVPPGGAIPPAPAQLPPAPMGGP